MRHSKYRVYNTYQFLAQNTGIIIIRYIKGKEVSNDLCCDLMSLALLDNVKKIHIYIDFPYNRYTGFSAAEFLYHVFYTCDHILINIFPVKKLKIIIHYYKFQLASKYYGLTECDAYELAFKNLRKRFSNPNIIIENKPATEHSFTIDDRDTITMIYLPDTNNIVRLYKIYYNIENLIKITEKPGTILYAEQFDKICLENKKVIIEDDGGIRVD